MTDKKLVNVREMAKILRVDKFTLYRWVKEGKVPYYQVNGVKRFDADEVLMKFKNKK